MEAMLSGSWPMGCAGCVECIHRYTAMYPLRVHPSFLFYQL